MDTQIMWTLVLVPLVSICPTVFYFNLFLVLCLLREVTILIQTVHPCLKYLVMGLEKNPKSSLSIAIGLNLAYQALS